MAPSSVASSDSGSESDTGSTISAASKGNASGKRTNGKGTNGSDSIVNGAAKIKLDVPIGSVSEVKNIYKSKKDSDGNVSTIDYRSFSSSIEC
jgi:hypothetical protein